MSKPVKAEYPQEVIPLGIQGRVYLELIIDESGKVVSVELTRGLHPKLDEAAKKAAWKLQFTPAIKNGKPVKQTLTYKFAFVLE